MLKLTLRAAALAALFMCGVDTSRAQPSPLPVPGDPVPRDGIPPIIKPGKPDPRRPVKPLPLPGQPVPVPGPDGNGSPGVIDTNSGGKKFGADGTGAGDGVGDLPPGVEGSETKVQEVIEWKSNFEQGVKCKKIPLDAKIRLDFNEITLGDLTKFISCITEQNFLLTAGVNRTATVTILSPKAVTTYEAYKAYLSALEANGLTIVPNGNFLEIIPSAESKAKGGPIYGVGKTGPNTDQMVTRLIQLDHIQADEILPIIEKFKTGPADITIYGPTNTIIITDTGANIRRILKLVQDLDVPIGKERIWIRPIVNAAAGDIATLLGQIIGVTSGTSGATGGAKKPAAKTRATNKQPAPTGPAAQPDAAPGGTSVIGTQQDLTSISVSKMFADERTNSIIFVATRTAYLQIDKIIRKLDVAIPGEGSIHIHPLENADAEEISQTLSALAGGARAGAAGQVRRPARAAADAAGAAAPAAAAAGGATAEIFEGDVKITAYKPKNALVIESSLKDYLSLQKVIRQLDVRRRQVYVEAIIMEISQNKGRKLGISGSGGAAFDVAGETVPLMFGVGGLGVDFQGALDTLSKGGAAVGLQGPMLKADKSSAEGGGTFSIPAFGFTLQALSNTTNVNVLSTPHILTLENEDAEIQVGKRQPYSSFSSGGLGGLSGLLGGLTGGTTSSTNPLASLGSLAGLGSSLGSQVQYVDVDLTLKINSTVNASDFVRMKIDQTIDDIDGFHSTGAPITSKRKIANTVEVHDGQAVVIGGLIRDQETETVDKVPFLGDIPLLGLLFRKTSTTVEKRNLLLIIIPHVIKDPSDLKRIYEQRQEEYREFARVMAERKKEFEGELDYRKKSGILEDVHKAVERAKADRELRERALYDANDIDPVGPPETHDLEYDPREGVKSSAPDGDEVEGPTPPKGKKPATPPKENP